MQLANKPLPLPVWFSLYDSLEASWDLPLSISRPWFVMEYKSPGKGLAITAFPYEEPGFDIDEYMEVARCDKIARKHGAIPHEAREHIEALPIEAVRSILTVLEIARSVLPLRRELLLRAASTTIDPSTLAKLAHETMN